MEKIIQIALGADNIVLLTNEGRLFYAKEEKPIWEELQTPPLHTNEIEHADPNHSCTGTICTGKCK